MRNTDTLTTLALELPQYSPAAKSKEEEYDTTIIYTKSY